MASLSEYQTDVRNLLRDPNASFYSTSNVNLWINKARSQVAAQAQCVRAMPPSSGSVDSVSMTATGSGYTSATVTFSAPDAAGTGFITATGAAVISTGSITAITISNPGTGYIAAPTVTIDGDGSGATATSAVTDFLATVPNQETYTFATANALIQASYPGYGAILGVQTVAVSWGAMKPVLSFMDWSSLQAYARSWPVMMNYPVYWAQYGQGVAGTMMLWPVPSIVSQMEWDCYCKVLDLSNTQTIDAIPYPWTEAVQYYAAYLGFLNAQRRDDASAMKAEFEAKMQENRDFVTPARVPNFYDGDS